MRAPSSLSACSWRLDCGLQVHEYVRGRLTMIPAAASEAATPLLKAAAYLSTLAKLHGLGNSLKQTLEEGGLAGLAKTHGMQVSIPFPLP